MRSKSYSRLITRSLAGLALLALSGNAYAQIFNETTDAGITIPTALGLPSGTTTVNGTLTPGDYDLFTYVLNSPGEVEFFLGFSSFDDNLLLFNNLGQAIGASDDQGATAGFDDFDSRITINLTPGTYYIGVGVNNMAAFTDALVEIVDNDQGDANGVLPGGPTAGSLGFIGTDEGVPHSDSGSYVLTVSVPSGAAAPEPGSLLLVALAGAISLRRRSL